MWGLGGDEFPAAQVALVKLLEASSDRGQLDEVTIKGALLRRWSQPGRLPIRLQRAEGWLGARHLGTQMPTGPAGDKEGWVGTVPHQREHIPLKVGCYHCTVPQCRP